MFDQKGEVYRIVSDSLGDHGRLLDVVVTENGGMGALNVWALRQGYSHCDPSMVTIDTDGMSLIFGNVSARLA